VSTLGNRRDDLEMRAVAVVLDTDHRAASEPQ
jgi:hypothetical protein